VKSSNNSNYIDLTFRGSNVRVLGLGIG